jgi:hypothetical protein
MNGIDLFSGARGWEALAHRTLGVDLLGIEHWEPAVLTSRAAGLRTLHADVSTLDPLDHAAEVGGACGDGTLVRRARAAATPGGSSVPWTWQSSRSA